LNLVFVANSQKTSRAPLTFGFTTGQTGYPCFWPLLICRHWLEVYIPRALPSVD